MLEYSQYKEKIPLTKKIASKLLPEDMRDSGFRTKITGKLKSAGENFDISTTYEYDLAFLGDKSPLSLIQPPVGYYVSSSASGEYFAVKDPSKFRISKSVTSPKDKGKYYSALLAAYFYYPHSQDFRANKGHKKGALFAKYNKLEGKMRDHFYDAKFRGAFGLVNTAAITSLTLPAITTEFYVDYIYLDTDERRRFAQISHEYLIEQVQHQVEGTESTSYTLNLNHPVKELIWTDASSVTTEKANLKLNGHDRFSEQHREYFQLRQPFDHHTAVPRQNLPSAARSSLVSHTTTVQSIENLTSVTLTNPANDTPASPGEVFFTGATYTLTLVITGGATVNAGTVLLFHFNDAGGTTNDPGTYIATVKTTVTLPDGASGGDILFTGPPVLLSNNSTPLAANSDHNDVFIL